MHQFAHYEHLAVLFDYPRRDYPTWVQTIYDLLAGKYVLAAAHIDAFAKSLPTDGGPFDPEALDEVQEIEQRGRPQRPTGTRERMVSQLLFSCVCFGNRGTDRVCC
mgnify:CR=1 FL=1